MPKQGPDRKKIEEIIRKAEKYLRMPNPPELGRAFGDAANDVLGKGHLAWGEYKKTAQGMYLNRKKELDKFKHNELLRGAQEAAWARRDAEMIEAEKNNDILSELKGREGRNKNLL